MGWLYYNLSSYSTTIGEHLGYFQFNVFTSTVDKSILVDIDFCAGSFISVETNSAPVPFPKTITPDILAFISGISTSPHV